MIKNLILRMMITLYFSQRLIFLEYVIAFNRDKNPSVRVALLVFGKIKSYWMEKVRDKTYKKQGNILLSIIHFFPNTFHLYSKIYLNLYHNNVFRIKTILLRYPIKS